MNALTNSPRPPHARKLTLASTSKLSLAPIQTETHGNFHIDELGTVPGEAKELSDVNRVDRSESAMIQTEDRMFNSLTTAGRVDLLLTGNTVQAATNDVTAFTLLLSPDVFDFSQPIEVVTNGSEVFNAHVERSVRTLLKWAARDNDRTMLYGAELNIKLKR